MAKRHFSPLRLSEQKIQFVRKPHFSIAKRKVSTTFEKWGFPAASSRIFCRECRPLWARTCVSRMIVHQHTFRLQCLITSMIHIREGGLDMKDTLLGLHIPRPVFWRFSSGSTWNRVFIRRLWIHWTRIVIASIDIANLSGMFERIRQSLVRRCRLCNNFRGLQFLWKFPSFPFWPWTMMYCL